MTVNWFSAVYARRLNFFRGHQIDAPPRLKKKCKSFIINKRKQNGMMVTVKYKASRSTGDENDVW